MSGIGWRGALAALTTFSALSWGLMQAGCGDDSSTNSSFVPPGDDGGDGANIIGDETQFNTDGNNGPVTSISIVPANPVVTVIIDDGVITTSPVTSTAISNNNTAVPASFSLDRGELGDLVAATGVFTASGNVSGTGNVTAAYSGLTATTTVTVFVEDWDCPLDRPLVTDIESGPLTPDQKHRISDLLAEINHFQPDERKRP